jgi:hypothetical protein
MEIDNITQASIAIGYYAWSKGIVGRAGYDRVESALSAFLNGQVITNKNLSAVVDRGTKYIDSELM